MLRDPYVNTEFEPDLMWFIGVFNVYDREETLGHELYVYNPNNFADRQELIRKYSLDLSYLSYRHKFVLVEELARKLRSESYDFQSLFEIDEAETSRWPRDEWYELDDPRAFLSDVYSLENEVWAEELLKASLEDRS